MKHKAGQIKKGAPPAKPQKAKAPRAPAAPKAPIPVARPAPVPVPAAPAAMPPQAMPPIAMAKGGRVNRHGTEKPHAASMAEAAEDPKEEATETPAQEAAEQRAAAPPVGKLRAAMVSRGEPAPSLPRPRRGGK